MEIRTKPIVNGINELVDVKYTEVNTQDKFSLKEEEPIRNEIINVLAKHNLPFKESVVQEIK